MFAAVVLRKVTYPAQLECGAVLAVKRSDPNCRREVVVDIDNSLLIFLPKVDWCEGYLVQQELRCLVETARFSRADWIS
jgi:hypothetical protein